MLRVALTALVILVMLVGLIVLSVWATLRTGLTVNWAGVAALLAGLAAIVGACTPLMLGIMNRNQQAAAKLAAERVEETRQVLDVSARTVAAKVEQARLTLEISAKDTSEKVELIHKAVNSERKALMDKIEIMHGEILKLTQEARVVAIVPPFNVVATEGKAEGGVRP
jgi:hypothetical protein